MQPIKYDITFISCNERSGHFFSFTAPSFWTPLKTVFDNICSLHSRYITQTQLTTVHVNTALKIQLIVICWINNFDLVWFRWLLYSPMMSRDATVERLLSYFHFYVFFANSFDSVTPLGSRVRPKLIACSCAGRPSVSSFPPNCYRLGICCLNENTLINIVTLKDNRDAYCDLKSSY